MNFSELKYVFQNQLKRRRVAEYVAYPHRLLLFLLYLPYPIAELKEVDVLKVNWATKRII